jgi:ABC-type branched-subunit amino acid transport system substrate-binding protein
MATRRRAPGGRRAVAPAGLIAALLFAGGCDRAVAPSVARPSPPPAAAPAPDDPGGRAARGRRIYQEGASPSGPAIVALIGGETEVPAALLACANCHGPDGRGSSEGGIYPSDLSWAALTKPYETVRPDGRRRPPYTEALVSRAITMGIDPAGAPLHPAMPRYRLSLADAADLIAYLKRLGRENDPGVTEAEIAIGVILPPGADAPGPDATVQGVLEAYFAALNRRGGIYHRRIVLQIAAMPRATDPEPAAERAIGAGGTPAFALLSANLAGGAPQVSALAQRQGIPLIEVAAPPAGDRPSPNRFAFYLLAGPDDQAVALARLALEEAPADAALAVVHGDDGAQRTLARAIADRCRRDGLAPAIVVEVPDAPAAPGEVAGTLRGAAAAILLGPSGRMGALLRALDARGDPPPVLVPGALADRDLVDASAGHRGRLLLALPLAPTDQTAAGLAEYQELATAHGLTGRHRPAQWAALAAAKLLVEGLRRAGRDLSRARLVEALEGLRGFRTGLTPPLTFGPGRRVGAPGAHAVAVDPEGRRLVPTGPWLDADGPPPPRAGAGDSPGTGARR